MNRQFARLVLTSIITFELAGAAHLPVASPGDLIAEINVPETDGTFGKAIGFDGHYLYYTEWAGTILHRINVPPPGLSNATGHVDLPIQGAPSGIMTISYDAGRDAFWAIGGDGLSMYLLDKMGQATLKFAVDPATDRPGNCKPRGILWMDGCSTEVKINYDGSDDTIWYAPDTSKRIYHYRTVPDASGTADLAYPFPYVDVDVPPNAMDPECGYSQVSGVAVGNGNLFVNISGCPLYFEFTKTGVKVASYPMQPYPMSDMECDDRSYPVAVFWSRSGWTDGRIYAHQQPSSTSCRFGG